MSATGVTGAVMTGAAGSGAVVTGAVATGVVLSRSGTVVSGSALGAGAAIVVTARDRTVLPPAACAAAFGVPGAVRTRRDDSVEPPEEPRSAAAADVAREVGPVSFPESALAIPQPMENTAAPIPRAAARPPTRPT